MGKGIFIMSAILLVALFSCKEGSDNDDCVIVPAGLGLSFSGKVCDPNLVREYEEFLDNLDKNPETDTTPQDTNEEPQISFEDTATFVGIGFANRVVECFTTYGQFYDDSKYSQAHLIDGDSSSLYSIGGFGAYVVLSFDHYIKNREGNDFKIYGNGQQEPALVSVSQDGIEWHEINTFPSKEGEYELLHVSARYEPVLYDGALATYAENGDVPCCRLYIDGVLVDTMANRSHNVQKFHPSNRYFLQTTAVELNGVPYLVNYNPKADYSMAVDGKRAGWIEFNIPDEVQYVKYVKLQSVVDYVNKITGEVSPEVSMIVEL